MANAMAVKHSKMTASSFRIKKDYHNSLTNEPYISSAFEQPKIQRRSVDMQRGFFGQIKTKP